MKPHHLLAVLLSLGICNTARADALWPPPSLRQMVKASEHIIVGFVADTFFRAGWGLGARIAVLEQLQRTINSDTIEVPYSPGSICPPSAEYFPGTYVLAFLQMHNGIFFTCNEALGAKNLTKEEIEVYKKRITEAQGIQNMTDSAATSRAIIEWLVKCTEQTATFWDGALELTPAGEKKDSIRRLLSPEQRRRLKSAVLANARLFAHRLSYEHFDLIDLVYEGNEQEVDSFLWDEFTQLPDDQAYMSYEYMKRLKHLAPSPQMTALMAQYEGLPWYAHSAHLALARQFIALVESTKKKARMHAKH